MKLSVLTFSKDDPGTLFELIKKVNDIASEIVIIDSSSEKNYLELRRRCKKNRRIRLFHYKALGYVEPFRMLGISKCTYEFIFYLDSDEYPNRKLINYLKRIGIPSHVSALRINRISISENNMKRPANIAGYDIRIFRRGKVRYYGIIHEVPVIIGDIIDLPLDCKVYNLAYEINNDPQKAMTIKIIEAYTNRKSYLDLINDTSKTAALIRWLIRLKLFLLNINKNDELSKSDYILFLVLARAFTNAIYNLINYRTLNLKNILNWANYQKGVVDYMFKVEPRKRKFQFLLSEQIKRHHGIINYLILNNKNLHSINNEKHYEGYDGLNLFIKLLSDRFYRTGVYRSIKSRSLDAKEGEENRKQ